MNTRIALLAALIAGPALAQTAPAPAPAAPAAPRMSDKLVNIPGTDWNIYGAGQTAKRDDKGGPQGYPSQRVAVAGKTANPWDVGGVSPTAKPIAAGDVVFVTVYLRAPNLKDGETTPVPTGMVAAAPPYASIAQGSAQVSNQWQRFYASGKATAAYAAGAANATVHLGMAKAVIDVGPVLIYDLGPDVDMTKLPH